MDFGDWDSERDYEGGGGERLWWRFVREENEEECYVRMKENIA